MITLPAEMVDSLYDIKLTASASDSSDFTGNGTPTVKSVMRDCYFIQTTTGFTIQQNMDIKWKVEGMASV